MELYLILVSNKDATAGADVDGASPLLPALRRRVKMEASLKQMIDFLQSEASEKAAEISLAAQEEASRERNSLIEQAKQKIRGDYERKEKQLDVQRRMRAPRLALLLLKMFMMRYISLTR